MATEHEEDRLRQLLRDDAWSLPAWPDVEARVRRTARRQRLHTASVSVAACALAAATVVLPLRLLGPAAQRTPGAGSRPAAPHSAKPASRTPGKSYTPPPVDAPGFPVVVYPPPRVQQALGTSFNCPVGSNVQPFSQGSSVQAELVMKHVGYSFGRDLQLTDRAFWPTIAQEWEGGGTRHFFPGRSAPVEYSGPLVDFQPLRWPPDLNNLIKAECGAWLRQSTWLIVAGPHGSPAAQNELLFINRGGHVLIYYAQ